MVPSASSFSRCPMIWRCRRPPTMCPSSRCTAIGNSVCMKSANAFGVEHEEPRRLVTRTDAW